MDKQQQMSTEQLSKFQEVDKIVIKRKFLLGSILATIIAGSPFLFYLYDYVPETADWETIFFTYHSGFYENARTAMWMLTSKIIPLFYLIIWFFTCRHWWYHSLLVPIVMFIYQIIDAIIQDNNTPLDKLEIVYMLPIMAIVIPSIYLIKAKVFSKINDVDKTMQELEDEFKIRPKGIFNKLGNYF